MVGWLVGFVVFWFNVVWDFVMLLVVVVCLRFVGLVAFV